MMFSAIMDLHDELAVARLCRYFCLLNAIAIMIQFITFNTMVHVVPLLDMVINCNSTFAVGVSTDTKSKLNFTQLYSISCRLTGQKSNQIFLPIKIPYRTHSMLVDYIE